MWKVGNQSIGFPPHMQCFIFAAIERKGVWKKNHRPVIIQQKFPRTGVPNSSNERKRNEEDKRNNLPSSSQMPP
jgi:hypothetical protein